MLHVQTSLASHAQKLRTCFFGRKPHLILQVQAMLNPQPWNCIQIYISYEGAWHAAPAPLSELGPASAWPRPCLQDPVLNKSPAESAATAQAAFPGPQVYCVMFSLQQSFAVGFIPWQKYKGGRWYSSSLG